MTETLERMTERLRGVRADDTPPIEAREPLAAWSGRIARLERCALRAEDIAAHAHQALDAVCAGGRPENAAPGAEDLVAILQIAADIRGCARQVP